MPAKRVKRATPPPNILVVSLGGTITGTAKHASDVQGYTPGALNPTSFLRRIARQLGGRVRITLLDFAQTGSPDFGSDQWIECARLLRAESESFDGLVLLVGTDVIEFAFFLYNVIALRIPVVLSGAYRPATSISADGERNIYTSILVAINKRSRDRGVLWTSNDRIHSAYYVDKHHANRVDGIHAGGAGDLGYLYGDEVVYHYNPSLPMDPRISIDLNKITDLPRVDILISHSGSKADLFFAAVENTEDPAKGIILQGMGAGSWPTEPGKRIMEYSIDKKFPVVVCRGPDEGHVGEFCVYGLGDECIGGGNLSPKKARIKLQLLLCKRASYGEIKKAFRNDFI